MAAQDSFLRIRLHGDRIGRSRIPVPHLLRVLSEFDKVVGRTAMLLLGNVDANIRGYRRKDLRQALSLDLVAVSEGSPATTLALARGSSQLGLPGLDFGLVVFKKAIVGLTEVQDESQDQLPGYVDRGVLQAWRDLGVLLREGVDEIHFSLDHGPEPVLARYDRKGRTLIEARVAKPTVAMRTVVGQMLMVDLGPSPRCRVYPLIGASVPCVFSEEQHDQVYDSLLRYVRVTGEATVDPVTDEVTQIKVADIQIVDDAREADSVVMPSSHLLTDSFWTSPTIDELARSQNVNQPVSLDLITGSWPGDVADGFEDSIIRLRLGQR